MAIRDRHGRGSRTLRPWNSAPRFDDAVHSAIDALEPTWGAALRSVEFVVADIPDVDHITESDVVDGGMPLAELVSGSPTRIVFYRHPITLRCNEAAELSALVLDVLIEQVAALVGVEPEDVDERYGDSD
jgi:predicted Zn-dependent protease with MMP-like domain